MRRDPGGPEDAHGPPPLVGATDAAAQPVGAEEEGADGGAVT